MSYSENKLRMHGVAIFLLASVPCVQYAALPNLEIFFAFYTAIPKCKFAWGLLHFYVDDRTIV